MQRIRKCSLIAAIQVPKKKGLFYLWNFVSSTVSGGYQFDGVDDQDDWDSGKNNNNNNNKKDYIISIS